MNEERRHYRLTHLAPAEVEEQGKVSVCVRCQDEEGRPRAWTFWFADIYAAMDFREMVIAQDGLYR